MKTAAIALVIVILAPLAAAGHLSNEQVLARLDEAAAAEARWILAASECSTGASGVAGHYTRAATAYVRLLRTKDHQAFELLTHSESATVACYGVAGVSELAPQRLTDLLPHLITRREEVRYYGTISFTTCPAGELLRSIDRMEAPPDKRMIGDAWRTFLGHLETTGATGLDRSLIHYFQKLLDELTLAPAPAALAYALALADPAEGLAEGPDEWIGRLRAVATGDIQTSARLALQALAAGETPLLKTDLIGQVWARDLSTPDAVFDLRVSAEFWDRVAQGTNRPRFDEPAEWYDCPWHSLTQRDWDWLSALDDPSVSESVKRLKANPIAGWQVDAEIPQDADARRHAVLCLLAAGARDNGLQSQRARYQLLKALDDDPAAVSLNLPFNNMAGVGELMVKVLGADAILSLAGKAAGSDDRSTFIAGMNFLGCLLEHDPPATTRVTKLDHFPALLERLLKECESINAPDLWTLRLLAFEFLDTAWTRARDAEIEQTMERWMVELANHLVNTPRAMPPTLDGQTLLDWVDRHSSRAGAILWGIYNGDDFFRPDGEYVVPPESELSPTPAIILRRMREAAALIE